MMENPASNDSLINRLPDDCLAHIFSFLPILERLQVARVCKRWHNVSQRGWNNIEELKIENEYSDNMFHSLLKRCGRFLKKMMIYVAPEQVNYLPMIIKFCKLEKLEDFGILIYPEHKNQELHIQDVREIFDKTKKLTAVMILGNLISYKIDHLDFLNPEILQKLDLVHEGDTPLSINPDRFPNLRILNLENFEIFGDEMKREQGSLKSLETMDIGKCHIPHNFTQRIKTFTNLQQLTLTNNICDISDEHIRGIARNCADIFSMALTGSSNVTSDCFEYLGKMPSLEILHLKFFDNVDTDDLVYLENVIELSFCGCSNITDDDGLLELIANSSNLEELKLSFIPQLSATFLNEVRQLFDYSQRRKRLTLEIVSARGDEIVSLARELNDHPLLNLILI